MKMLWRRQKIDISVQSGVTMGVAGSEAAGAASTEAGVIELQGVE